MSQDDRTALLWRQALFTCLTIGILALAAGVARHLRLPTHPLWVFAAAGSFNLAMAALLYLRRAQPTRWLAILASLAGTWALLPAQWHSMVVAVLAGRPWTPFQGIKMVALLTALLGPEVPWLMVANIGALVVSSVTQYFSFSAPMRAGLTQDEPWATVMYGVVALLLFFYRYRRNEAAQRAAGAIAEAASLQRMARVFLAVRDLTNTPLQTLQICVELIERGHPELTSKVRRMKRSLERLKELERLLARYEREVDWHGAESFDARGILAAELPEDQGPS